MNKTETLLGYEARKKVLAGVNKVYNAVRRTLGPSGKNALLPRTMNRGPRVTNDGVTVSENQMPKNPHERLAADFFKEGSKKTNDEAGDGTTGTAVIAGHLVNKVFKELPDDSIPSASLKGHNPNDVMAMRKEMLSVKDQVIEEIKKVAKPIKDLKDLEKIALVSIEDEKASKTVASMVWELGKDNFIDTTEGYKGEIETEVIKGMRFPAKVAAPAFVNKQERKEMVAEDTKVLVTNYKLDNPFEVVSLLNEVKAPKIAIIAPSFSNNTLVALINTIKNGIFVYPVSAPSLRDEQMKDVAVYTGATFIDKMDRKLDSVSSMDLGFVGKMVIKDSDDREDGIVVGGKGEKAVKERCDMLKEQIVGAKNAVAKGQLKRRIANMASAVGVIRVGASTDAESLYLKLKIEDGVYACKAALEEGYVEGGGLCLKKIADQLPENILTASLKAPYEQIQENAGTVVKIGKDIIDPAKVVRLEVEHGVSVASTLITTDVVTADTAEQDPSDGYKMIAKALLQGVYFQAKERGMMTESEEEQSKDMARLFAEAQANDLD